MLTGNWCPPFKVIPMPVDKDGAGPADCENTVRTIYEIWDDACVTVCECSSEESANLLAALLNEVAKR